jgi:hypothetical protein
VVGRFLLKDIVLLVALDQLETLTSHLNNDFTFCSKRL